MFATIQIESNPDSLQCDAINVTIINYSIFIEWNAIQQLTQIKKELHVFAGCISEVILIQKKSKNKLNNNMYHMMQCKYSLSRQSNFRYVRSV